MAEKKKIFDNAWELYSSSKANRKAFKASFPEVAKLFSSGNKAIAEQKFYSSLLPYASFNGKEGIIGMFLDDSGKKKTKVDEILIGDMSFPVQAFLASRDEKKMPFVSSKNLPDKLKKAFLKYFVSGYKGNESLAEMFADKEVYDNALEYGRLVSKFKDMGYSDGEAEVLALPTNRFKSINEILDTEGGYKYVGKDGVKNLHEDYYKHRLMPKVPEGADPQKENGDATINPEDIDFDALGNIVKKGTGLKGKDKDYVAGHMAGHMSNLLGKKGRNDILDEKAKKAGFFDGDALMKFLDDAEVRNDILDDEEDDNIFQRLGKTVLLGKSSSKWKEGRPSELKDNLYDAAYGAIQFTPQGKIIKEAKAPAMVAIQTSKKPFLKGMVTNLKDIGNALNNLPKLKVYLKEVAPTGALIGEEEFLDSLYEGRPIDFENLAIRTLGNSIIGSGANYPNYLRRKYKLEPQGKTLNKISNYHNPYADYNAIDVSRMVNSAADELATREDLFKTIYNRLHDVRFKNIKTQGPAKVANYNDAYKLVYDDYKAIKKEFPNIDKDVFNETFEAARRAVDNAPSNAVKYLDEFINGRAINATKEGHGEFVDAAEHLLAGLKNPEIHKTRRIVNDFKTDRNLDGLNQYLIDNGEDQGVKKFLSDKYKLTENNDKMTIFPTNAPKGRKMEYIGDVSWPIAKKYFTDTFVKAMMLNDVNSYEKKLNSLIKILNRHNNGSDDKRNERMDD